MNSSVPATIIQMSLKTVFKVQLKKNLQEQRLERNLYKMKILQLWRQGKRLENIGFKGCVSCL